MSHTICPAFSLSKHFSVPPRFVRHRCPGSDDRAVACPNDRVLLEPGLSLGLDQLVRRVVVRHAPGAMEDGHYAIGMLDDPHRGSQNGIGASGAESGNSGLAIALYGH